MSLPFCICGDSVMIPEPEDLCVNANPTTGASY